MKNFSTDAAGFAALTLSELILQQCLLSGLITPAEARGLLAIAARRHEDAATGSDDKITLNMEAAHLIRTLSLGLEPLLADRAATGDTAATVSSGPLHWPGRTVAAAGKAAPPPRRDTWVRFPD